MGHAYRPDAKRREPGMILLSFLFPDFIQEAIEMLSNLNSKIVQGRVPP
jgi:hypothetical protein